jgi:hypothetical protein
MFSALWSKWLCRPPQHFRRRPRLEALEDRCVPSTVTNLSDHDPGSLRDAIATTPSGGTVTFQPGLAGTITLTTGELTITKNLTIAGPGAEAIRVSGNHASRVFEIAATSTVAISGLTIADGEVSSGDGGGILNAGTLTVTDATISGNSASVEGGGIDNELSGTLTVTNSRISGNTANNAGGIRNDGTLAITSSAISGNAAVGAGGIDSYGMLTLTNSTISGNTAVNAGGIDVVGTATITFSTISGNSAAGSDDFIEAGGINIQGGISLTLMNSTVSGNSATGPVFAQGGGIWASVAGSVTIINSTVSGNSATGGFSGDGGGIYDSVSTVSIMNSTISGNSASDGGGILSQPVGTRVTTIRNTIVAGNTAAVSPDVAGGLNSQGHNLIGNGTGGSGFAASDLVGTSAQPVDPKLGPLQNNGGPTQTMALLPGSPAIDAGDNTGAPQFDQRGPGFPRIVNGTIDIGAFEVQAVALTVQCSVTTPVLAPPNHQLVNVGLSVQVSDPSATISVQVFANDDALPADAADLAPGTLRLRGERQGDGSGRVYLIVVTATDAAGDVAVGVCTVVVPHDQSADALAAVEQQAADAEAYFLAFHTAPPGYRPLG